MASIRAIARRRSGARPDSILLLSVLCAVLGLAGWAFYGYALRGQIGEDAMVFHTAARAWLGGDGARIYDGAWLTGQINARFAGWLMRPIPLHPWIYPPSFLLMLLPLGYLPFGAAFLLFEASSFIAIAAAVCSRRADRTRMLFSLLLSPAAAVNVLLGQNAFLTGALLIGGTRLLRRYPVAAGVLLGLLSYKPQLCLMLPVALLAGWHWRAAITAAITAVALALGSAALFGPDLWQAWITLLTGGGALFHHWEAEARLNGMSVYACLMLLGASPLLANLGQAAAITLAAGSVYRAFAGAMRDDMRLAVLLAATFLAAPHAANYDAILLSVAATLPLSVAAGERFKLGESALAAALWLCPLVDPPTAFPAGLFTPLLVLAFIATILGRHVAPDRTAPNSLASAAGAPPPATGRPGSVQA